MAGLSAVERTMSNVKDLYAAPVASERVRLSGSLPWAARNVLAARGTAWSVLITIALSIPLYAIDYHAGERPIVGFWLALVLGTVAAGASMGLVVASLIGKSRRIAVEGVACLWPWGCRLMLSLGVGIPLLILAWKHVVGPATNIDVLNGWYQNEWAATWKPLAHVASIAVLQLAIAPFAALAVPIVGVIGGSPVAAVAWVREHVHDKTYHALGLAYVGIALSILAFVPWVGLLVVPTMCLLLVRVFHFSFALGAEGEAKAVRPGH